MHMETIKDIIGGILILASVFWVITRPWWWNNQDDD